ncbi:unnamed protein product [Pseudo-nitzschia multistriata]|uniref:BSD domain-containing protein n=1 Tax=Pseudo-nitzschia multistriata TaxID=183589 RepID=A0A448ZGG3_9STRA|nr:unnamed protein product [Pseudo-nitzschia multistriata]
MWGALKKDFGEFVSTVATDANETLQAIDQKMDEPLVGQRTDDQGGDEGYMGQEASPIDLDTGMVLDHVVGDVEEEDGDEVFSWKSPDENPTAEEMRDQLVLCEDVFKDSLVSESDESTSKEEEEEKEEDRSDSNETPLLETVATATKPSNDDAARSFLEEFDVASKTDEISALLEENVALKTTFSMVATDQSEVTYSDFWTRYYFRIADPDRVAETYGVYYRKELEAFEQRREEAEAAARDAAANDNLARGISNVTNFFGGVVNRLTQEDDEGGADEAGVDESMDVDDESAPQTSGLGGFFNSVTGGGVGRPPFVLNTAVSDDEYDDYQAPEEEDDDDSEVELGWDDDDEDLESDDDDEQNTSATMQFKDGDDLSETVDFKDAEKEGLLDQLEQARAERDALQKTVAMQTEELKKARTADIAAISPPAAVLEGGDKDEEVQKLSIQLFEKDSELAALRAKLEDDKNEAKDQQQQQETLEKLLQSIAEKDAELEALRRSTDERIEMLQNTVDQKTTEQERLRTEWDSEKEALLLEKEANRQDTSVVTAEKADDAEMLALRSKIAEQEQKIEELVASKDAAEKANSVEIVALRSKVAEQEQKIEELVESTTAQEADGVEMASLRSKVAEQEQKIEDLVMSKATAQEADGAEMAALRSKVDEQEKKIEELAASKAAATEELQHQTEQSAQEQEALRTTLQLKIEGLEQRLLP